MIGQSKLRFTNTYIWDQPWFIELSADQKMAYFYIHHKCSDVGIYQHSEKAMENNLGFTYSTSEILEWINKKREMALLLEEGTILLQWLIKDHSKRGTKIKPISNPDLGKIREAIESNTLDILILNGTCHVECKLFEFGISESIIRNTTYSTKPRKGKQTSAYEDMIGKVRNCIDHDEGLKKVFIRLTEGLSNPLQSVLIQTPNKDKTRNQNHIQTIHQDQYTEIAIGFSFDGSEFSEGENVEKALECLSEDFANPTEWILNKKQEFKKGKIGNQPWIDFTNFITEELLLMENNQLLSRW